LESFYPYFSRRSPDALIKRRYVRAPPQWGRPAHKFANVTDDQLSAGKTAQVIETGAGRWQIHQFGTAILISPAAGVCCAGSAALKMRWATRRPQAHG
jgi:hypothetical protein